MAVTQATEVTRSCRGVDIDLSRLHSFAGYVDGYRRTWKMYLPKRCEGGGVYPLLISLHGGDYQTMHEYAAWHLLAEREGILVLFPESLVNGVTWNSWDVLGEDEGRTDDVSYLDQLLTYVLENYPADETRVYLHGQSMGDMMATQYAFCHPERLAGVAPFSGPTKTRWYMEPDGTMKFLPTGPLPCLRLRGENDNFVLGTLPEETSKLRKRQCHIEVNNNLWKAVNGCAETPLLTTTETRNTEFWPGKEGCDLTFTVVKDGMHRPPADFIEDMWQNLMRPYRRVNGRIVAEHTAGPVPDAGAVAICAGSRDAYVDNRPVRGGAELLPAAMGEDGILRFDVRALPQLLPQVTAVRCGETLIRLECAAGETVIYPQSALALMEGRFTALAPLVREEGTYLVPFEGVMRLFGLQAHCAEDAGYAADHPFALTYDFCYTIAALLGQRKVLTNAEAYALEQEIYEAQRAEKGFGPPRNRMEEIWQWCHTV